MIDKYSFGYISINGIEYSKDVIIIGDDVFYPWWRKEGHSVTLEDLEYPLKKDVEEFIIGTGFYGFVNIDRGLAQYLIKMNKKIIGLKTQEAVKIYNSLKDEERKKKAFCLHLTC